MSVVPSGAAAAGGLGVLGPIGLVAGFGLALFQATQQRKFLREQAAALARSARFSQERINEQIGQSRVRAIFDSSNVARNIMRTVAIGSLGLPEGHSPAELISQEAQLAAQDTAVIRQGQEQSERAAELEKQNIVNAARSGINQVLSQAPSPVLAGLQGGLQGFQLGLGIQGSLARLGELKSRVALFDELAPVQRDMLGLQRDFMSVNVDLARQSLIGARAEFWDLRLRNALLGGRALMPPFGIGP
jgi:hypothetical protein